MGTVRISRLQFSHLICASGANKIVTSHAEVHILTPHCVAEVLLTLFAPLVFELQYVRSVPPRVVFVQAVVGLFALGTGIFGVTALGMGIMAGIVAVGVAKGELDPSPQVIAPIVKRVVACSMTGRALHPQCTALRIGALEQLGTEEFPGNDGYRISVSTVVQADRISNVKHAIVRHMLRFETCTTKAATPLMHPRTL